MTPDDVRLALQHYYDSIKSTQIDYSFAAARTAQYTYMRGTLLGVVLLGVLCATVATGIAVFGYSVASEPVATAFACAIAGGFGAAASVSWRVTTGEFITLDLGAGLLTLRALGSLRPLIGAIFGLAIYFALKSGFIDIGQSDKDFYFFAFLAFVAGFSERAVPDLLRGAERRLAGSDATRST
jgi:hypothetical protein